MFYYRGLIFVIEKSVLNKSKKDKIILNVEFEIMRLLQDNIDQNRNLY